MIRYIEILRLSNEGLSQRGISSSTGHSRRIIKEVIDRAKLKNLEYPFSEEITDPWLHQVLFPEKTPLEKGRKVPDFEWVHQELAKKGVTLTLLWQEYKRRCEAEEKFPYSYRQFCRDYTEFANKTKATLRIKRKPGEIMEVDWAGTTLEIFDEITGEVIPAYLFVATLPCSQYSYAEAFITMESVSWIKAHINAFSFFGGVPNMVVPDNLRTGITKSDPYSPTLNRSYQEMAEYYRTAIVPARVRKPTDKSTVEGAVGNMTTWIIAALRGQRFFSLFELNEAIKEKLEEVNSKKFTKKEGSRLTAFEEEEKFALKPLPTLPFEYSSWRKMTVKRDYHLELGKMFYSVPYEYIGHCVEVRETLDIIEVYYKNTRIASHKKLKGRTGQSHTLEAHMPQNHRLYTQHTPETAREWAEKVGPSTTAIFNRIFEKYTAEAQALKIAMGFIKLAEKYSKKKIELACTQSLGYSTEADLKSIKLILALQEQSKKETVQPAQSSSTQYGYVRGAAYYGGLRK